MIIFGAIIFAIASCLVLAGLYLTMGIGIHEDNKLQFSSIGTAIGMLGVLMWLGLLILFVGSIAFLSLNSKYICSYV